MPIEAELFQHANAMGRFLGLQQKPTKAMKNMIRLSMCSMKGKRNEKDKAKEKDEEKERN